MLDAFQVFLNNTYMDTIISATSITSGADANVNITLEGCSINLSGDKLTPEYKILFPSGGEGLNLKYAIIEGLFLFTNFFCKIFNLFNISVICF